MAPPARLPPDHTLNLGSCQNSPSQTGQSTKTLDQTPWGVHPPTMNRSEFAQTMADLGSTMRTKGTVARGPREPNGRTASLLSAQGPVVVR